MSKNLTNSQVDRQNILNNKYAIEEIQNAAGIKGIIFENEIKFTKSQVAEFFEIDTKTIERYVEKYSDELSGNGYEILRGKRLKLFISEVKNNFVTDIDVGHKTVNLAIFNFRAFLNLAMLLSESEKARILRGIILDVVIDTINKKTGGGTKYINQRDEDYIISYFQQENYRNEFTEALKNYVDMGKAKYPIYTDKIYLSIFKEKAKEYREILKLSSRENLRETMYSEVLDIISSYEYGFAKELEEESDKLGRPLTIHETDLLFNHFEQRPHWKPLREKARVKMASRDFAFRDALHTNLEEYIKIVPSEDFERFLGDKSKELYERLEEYKDVFKRLKERE